MTSTIPPNCHREIVPQNRPSPLDRPPPPPPPEQFAKYLLAMLKTGSWLSPHRPRPRSICPPRRGSRNWPQQLRRRSEISISFQVLPRFALLPVFCLVRTGRRARSTVAVMSFVTGFHATSSGTSGSDGNVPTMGVYARAWFTGKRQFYARRASHFPFRFADRK